MTGYVLDTSVAIAWYLPETFAESARIWQARALEGEVGLYVPTLHYWEFANVLRTYVRRGEIDRRLATELWQLHLEAPLHTSDPASSDVLTTAFEYETTAYDAVYITLSLQLELRLLTAERASTAWVRKMGKRAFSVS